LKAALQVGNDLLSVVALGVGLPEDGLNKIFDEPLVVQRLMCYPARGDISDATPDDIGCGAHYDFGGLTLLRQVDAPGLQVQRPLQKPTRDCRHVRINGAAYRTRQGTFFTDMHNVHVDEWTDVDMHPDRPDRLVVTFGEALQRLTNGKVQATRHRVIHSGKSKRHSMAVFVDPNPFREVAPLSELAGTRPLYSSRMAGHKTVDVPAMNKVSPDANRYLGFGVV